MSIIASESVGSAHSPRNIPRIPVPLSPTSQSPPSEQMPPAYREDLSLPSQESHVHDRQSSQCDQLPVYTETTITEPETLARGLWRWGWVMPILWVIGMFILWIPLKPEIQERDPEKAQKLEEMIAILRKTELKYAKRCLYGALGWLATLVIIILVTVLISVLR